MRQVVTIDVADLKYSEVRPVSGTLSLLTQNHDVRVILVTDTNPVALVLSGCTAKTDVVD